MMTSNKVRYETEDGRTFEVEGGLEFLLEKPNVMPAMNFSPNGDPAAVANAEQGEEAPLVMPRCFSAA